MCFSCEVSASPVTSYPRRVELKVLVLDSSKYIHIYIYIYLSLVEVFAKLLMVHQNSKGLLTPQIT